MKSRVKIEEFNLFNENIKRKLPVQKVIDSERVPIVIDHGSWMVRAGYAASFDDLKEGPHLQFENLVSKSRSDNSVHIGGGQYCDRSGARSAFDSNESIIVHPIMLENVLDFTFQQLQVSSQDCVNHPIVFTETLCNLNQSRALVNELLFECYKVPSIAFGVDSLFSHYYNHQNGSNLDGKYGLIINSGHHSTQVIPVVNGRADFTHCKRLDIGGSYTTDFMNKSLILKYPQYSGKMSSFQSQKILHRYGSIMVGDYKTEMLNYLKDDYLNQNDHIIILSQDGQLEQQRLDEIEERKEKARIKMMQRVNEQRTEKLQQKRRQLQTYKQLFNEIQSFNKNNEAKQKDEGDSESGSEVGEIFTESDDDDRQVDWEVRLNQYGFDSEEQLEQSISELEREIIVIDCKMQGKEPPLEEPQELKPPDTSLILIPDDQLTSQQVKEKRRQKLMKASYEQRLKVRQQKQEMLNKLAEKEKAETEFRQKDLNGYIQNLHQKKKKLKDIINKLQQRTQSGRGNSQKRLKLLATLAGQENESSQGKQRKNRQSEGDDDDFGWDDQDWDIYHRLDNNEDGKLEYLQAELEKIEESLLQYDPDYVSSEQLEREQVQNCLWYKMRFEDDEDLVGQEYIKVNVECQKVPEIMFQPNLFGNSSAGLSEICNTIVKIYGDDLGRQMVQTVFLSGSHSLYPGFDRRLEFDIRMNMPAGTNVKVIRAQNSQIDAWRGAAQWALDNVLSSDVYLTRKIYEECGHDYLVEHNCSNLYIKY